jgi:hypothetical protein
MQRWPKIISLVPTRFEDGGWSGVPRFDWELRRAFPEIVSLRSRGGFKWMWRRFREMRGRDVVVITGNENSLDVPEHVRCIVMHHGCALTHFERDPLWRSVTSRRWCRAQRKMYTLGNRWFVAAARWTAQEFSRHLGVAQARVIPNWVELIRRDPATRNSRPVILGDWRTFNKGSEVVKLLQTRLPHLDFRLLATDYHNRASVYGKADGYLCLSLSEGGAFSVSDAEATALPLVTTDVGNYLEYDQAQVVPWQERDNLERVVGAIETALRQPRGPSFFESWTIDRWRQAWRELITEVADSEPRPPLLET